MLCKEDLVKIQDLGFKNIKVASYDCGSFPMIREICKKFKNIFISTGATFDDEIKKTKLICQKFKVNPVFLHCVTIYPTLQKDFNLKEYLFKSLTKCWLFRSFTSYQQQKESHQWHYF